MGALAKAALMPLKTRTAIPKSRLTNISAILTFLVVSDGSFNLSRIILFTKAITTIGIIIMCLIVTIIEYLFAKLKGEVNSGACLLSKIPVIIKPIMLTYTKYFKRFPIVFINCSLSGFLPLFFIIPGMRIIAMKNKPPIQIAVKISCKAVIIPNMIGFAIVKNQLVYHY
jgi:hypothetical protein